VSKAASSSPELLAVLAMLETLDALALAELERALRLRLTPALTAAERRVDELGFLARLLDELPATTRSNGIPQLDRAAYESRQPLEAPDAPTAKTLVANHGSWQRVCRAAFGLLPDGRTRAKVSPWASTTRGKPRTLKYTREEARSAIRSCADSLGRLPDASAYQRWSTETKRLARERGAEVPRLPSLRAIYRHYPKGENRWRLAVADAALTDGDIARARTERVLRLPSNAVLPETAEVTFAGADPAQLAAIGIKEQRRKQALRYGLGVLTLREAIAVAQLLDGSLDWLAGIDVERDAAPSDDTRFDVAAVKTFQEKVGTETSALRQRVGLPLGRWRRLMNGNDEPDLGEVISFAATLGCSPRDLVTS
jgi:predicted RNA-binding Zn ribbon-like protein